MLFNCTWPNISSQRKKGFKKAIDVDEGRRRREETTLQIRKTKKDVRLAKRRQMPTGMGSNMDTPAALAAASMLAAGGAAPGGYGEKFFKRYDLFLREGLLFLSYVVYSSHLYLYTLWTQYIIMNKK